MVIRILGLVVVVTGGDCFGGGVGWGGEDEESFDKGNECELAALESDAGHLGSSVHTGPEEWVHCGGGTLGVECDHASGERTCYR